MGLDSPGLNGPVTISRAVQIHLKKLVFREERVNRYFQFATAETDKVEWMTKKIKIFSLKGHSEILCPPPNSVPSLRP